MEPLYDLGLQASQWLQTNYPQLEGFFRFMSNLGLEEFYLAIIPLLYWSIDKQLGRNLAYVFLFTNAWNGMLKHAFRGPRPFWLDSSLELWPEESYGIPSGHAQLATAVYLFLAGWIRKRWGWLVAIFMVLAMGVSRIYLGSHFIHDVVAGTLIAILILLGYVLWRENFAQAFEKRILGFRLMVAILVPVSIALVYTFIRLLIGAPDETVAWSAYIPAAELAGLESVATAVGSLLGAGIGLTLEGSRVRFKSSGLLWQRALRFVIGIVITLALWAGLDQIFPSDPLWLAIPQRVLRYGVVLLWVAYYAPWVFVRLKLAEAEPPLQITMTPP